MWNEGAEGAVDRREEEGSSEKVKDQSKLTIPTNQTERR